MARSLSIALDRYDRHVPFFMGLIEPPDGCTIEALEVGMVPPRRDGVDRHKRMLVDREFDIAEVSLASYILAKQKGAPLTAVPTAPRRLFSQNHVFVNVDSGIETAKDLIGRTVAIWAFQVTMSVLAKGDLQEEYDVPWREITWLTQRPEEIDWTPSGANIQRMPEGRTGADMVIAGEVDAYIDPHPPEKIFTDPRVRRLFPDAPAECRQYWDKHGYYPVMHLMAIKEELVEEMPDLPRDVMRMWDDARDQAYEFYVDHDYTVLPFGRYAYEHDLDTFREELWPSGLAANRKSLERFIGYMADQNLLKERVPVETLFHQSVLDT
jgi:4,5-dihydroxyphthalate decarboxylase